MAARRGKVPTADTQLAPTLPPTPPAVEQVARPLRTPPEDRRNLCVPQRRSPRPLNEHRRRRSAFAAAAALFLSVVVAYSFSSRTAPSPLASPGWSGRLVTHEELRRHDANSSEALWLAVCGEVFDVTRGRKYYGAGGGYAFFSGCDGTRAFVTGVFNETGLTDDVDGLSDRDLDGILTWVNFYHSDYTFVGRLVGGSFYDRRGEPLPPARAVRQGAAAYQASKEKARSEESALPACAAAWSSAEGGAVWCEQEGQVPRRLSRAGATRCACMPADAEAAKARLAPGATLEEYPGCSPTAQRCTTSSGTASVSDG